ncbi:septum site-determining protein MinC [Rhizobiales bacterium]|uniref:septum site-determining protein MinC n=1 Tax=Hongsoonwoonella zoysiae TaxID=2821844 RepID=UPI00155FEC07|nr:septum site-determining protein MinC [Hongsoonwoonella zoysiae]NRG17539.1 septum site-determining protein MinC [Hongsoonwoonella zoysiae]
MRFKGKSFIAIVLTPERPFEAWFDEVDRIISRSPGFFLNRPIILDARGSSMSIDELEQVLAGVKARSIQVMGIEGISSNKLRDGMPPSISGGKATKDVEGPDESADPQAGEKPSAGDKEPVAGTQAVAEAVEENTSGNGKSMLITEPVRSGQSIMNADGDVTVVGSVGSGAEVIAGGSIHIYGALRGRALAGVSGNEQARIFCSKLDAELVAINGMYKVADDFDRNHLHAAMQIRLERDSLIFEKLA